MSDYKLLMKYAINYLSKYSSSKANLEIILKKKIRRLQIENIDKVNLYHNISKIITVLEKNKFIDDINFAESKMRGFVYQGKSKNFIKSFFSKKGIDKHISNKIIEDLDKENLNWEIESARKFASKRNILKNIEHRNKNLAKMARAGFSYEISKKILDEL